MNNTLKVFIAILGAVNIMFGIFIPISISLLLINTIDFNQTWHITSLLLAGTISSLYRAIDVAFLRG